MKSKLNKIFTWIMWALIAISVGLVVWGATTGYPETPAADNGTVDPLLYWAYIVLGIGVACWVVFGLIIAIVNDPKSLIKLGAGLVGILAICFVAYLIAPGEPALSLFQQPSVGVLKLTDTLMYITAFVGSVAILAIAFGEVLSAIRNR